ncbi:hypothetical protein G5V59_10670 [Nocardioides sp. W3-2-3]|uniref:hypothetical protein n=1 Tax=Nocardioides convexus TaxID=2712224 RepID=UPI0024186ED7|nr:hypothetical protein [Nocardioides convexus]NHA00395.1 hypothetical protein [Nocardioides convexus]
MARDLGRRRREARTPRRQGRGGGRRRAPAARRRRVRRRARRRRRQSLPRGAKVSGVDVGGMSRSAAIDKARARAWARGPTRR